MNKKVSSGADDGLERQGAAQEAAARFRSAATALLSAAEIWSTNEASPPRTAAAAPVHAPAVAPVPVVETPVARNEPGAVDAAPAVADPPEVSIDTGAVDTPESKAEARFFSSHGRRNASWKLDTAAAGDATIKPPPLAPSASTDVEIARAFEKHALAALAMARESAAQTRVWPPQRLSLALQGGGSFAAFTWGALERLLEEPACDFDCVSGASVGAINAALLACGLVQGGRDGARKLLSTFWQRMTDETSFRSLMLVGGFSPAGSSVAFGPTVRARPFDLDPLREVLSRDIDFGALRYGECPKVLVAATRVRDGRQQIFDNEAITADVLLASTCPPLAHCAVEIDGESYWDGGYGSNPPLVRLVQESATPDVLVVQVTPSHDSYVPITAAAIDRRLDQITANAALHAELSALEWARERGATSANIHRIAAEDEIDGLAQRNPADLGRGFMTLLRGRGRSAADRWLRGTTRARPIRVAPAQRVREHA